MSSIWIVRKVDLFKYPFRVTAFFFSHLKLRSSWIALKFSDPRQSSFSIRPWTVPQEKKKQPKKNDVSIQCVVSRSRFLPRAKLEQRTLRYFRAAALSFAGPAAGCSGFSLASFVQDTMGEGGENRRARLPRLESCTSRWCGNERGEGKGREGAANG